MAHLAEIRVPEPHNNYKNNITNFTRGHLGQIPVIRCFVQKNLHGCIRNQGWARSRARVRIVESVSLSVVEACHMAPRLSVLCLVLSE